MSISAVVMITFSLIGETTLNINGHDVRQCQYIAKNSQTPTVVTTYVPPSMNCKRSLQFLSN